MEKGKQGIHPLLKLIGIFISWVIVAFGQPAWVPELGPIAAICGYALFWISTAQLSTKPRALLAGGWFFSVQLIQLSWMTSIEYQGIYILFVYGGLCLWLGGQFALFTAFLKRMSPLRILAAASLWTLLEWSRLYLFSGFTWNPVGLSLTTAQASLQFAAVWGIYGLSFWVMLVNLVAVKAVVSRQLRVSLLWVGLACVPACFGWFHTALPPTNPTSKTLSVALVQTGLLPAQKVPLPGRYDQFITPFEQCQEILRSLTDPHKTQWDLIVLPEAVVPLSMQVGVYGHTEMLEMIAQQLGSEALLHLPPLQAPFAELRQQTWCVSNAFWAQFLANYFHSEVVVGLDHYDPGTQQSYNAAFHFSPYSSAPPTRYDKQILLPLAEYLPWNWLKRWTKNYGIVNFFTPGKGPGVVGKLSLSICYEETFAALMRKGRLEGAELFVNVTNDNYYPHSRLPQQHFDHAKLRAVENGVPLLRACNTGVTAAVDRFGRTIALLGEEGRAFECTRGVLECSISLEHHSTLYTFWGDRGILSLCWALVLIFFLKSFPKMLLKNKSAFGYPFND